MRGGGPDDRDDSRHYAALWADQTQEVQRGREVVLGVMFWENFCAAWMDQKFILFFNNTSFSSRGGRSHCKSLFVQWKHIFGLVQLKKNCPLQGLLEPAVNPDQSLQIPFLF